MAKTPTPSRRRSPQPSGSEEPHARARALALAAGALSRTGDPQGALREFSQALSTAASMNRDVIGRIAVLVDIAFRLATNGP